MNCVHALRTRADEEAVAAEARPCVSRRIQKKTDKNWVAFPTLGPNCLTPNVPDSRPFNCGSQWATRAKKLVVLFAVPSGVLMPTQPSPPSFLLITDPGPDPDDVKAILALAVYHKVGRLQLKGVVANGGHEAEARALLARAALDYVGASDVAVGVGSQGLEQPPQPHEYDMPGFSRTMAPFLQHGFTLLQRIIASAAPKSLTVVCISSLRDVADVIQDDPEQFVATVERISIMGGVEKKPEGLVPDTSTNNSFDMQAAAFVYNFCLQRGVPMTITSRHAVPLVPMKVEHDFAEESDDAMLGYLHDAQILGLLGLWKKLCAGRLPARCDKRWFFKTFCGVDDKGVDQSFLDKLDASANIRVHLNG